MGFSVRSYGKTPNKLFGQRNTFWQASCIRAPSPPSPVPGLHTATISGLDLLNGCATALPDPGSSRLHPTPDCARACLLIHSVCSASRPRGPQPATGSSVRGVLQARILECVPISFSRGSSQPRDRTCISSIGRWVLYLCVTSEAQGPD